MYETLFFLTWIAALLNSVVWLVVGVLIARTLWDYMKHQESVSKYINTFQKYFKWK
jgi:uncharacterized membrane-anchored protein YhcB (DUF1043 family)